jgi:hypothetical protein
MPTRPCRSGCCGRGPTRRRRTCRRRPPRALAVREEGLARAQEARALGAASTAVLKAPDRSDLGGAEPVFGDESFGLPLERRPAPAVTAARAVLIRPLHRLVVGRLLRRAHGDRVVESDQSPSKLDRDVVRIGGNDPRLRRTRADRAPVARSARKRSVRSTRPEAGRERPAPSDQCSPGCICSCATDSRRQSVVRGFP